MLELKEVTRNCGQKAVLSRITLTVQRGELVSILGPTGSGKTSLLRVILGLDLIDQGEIRLAGEPLAGPNRNLIAPEARRISLVFEKTTLLPFMNVEKNILVGVQTGDEGAFERLEEILTLLDLSELRSRPSHELSGGEQQRVALARCLFVRPELLLLDEPFRNIDRPWRDRFISKLKAYLARRGTAAILVTHDRDEAFSFSQRIFLLRDGALVRCGTPEELYLQPRAQWDAQLLGECNVLPADEAARTLGFEPRSPDVKCVMIRPEHLEVCETEPHNATLEHRRFFGFYTELSFRVKNDMRIKVKALADDDRVTDRTYRLRLRSDAHVIALEADPHTEENETP